MTTGSTHTTSENPPFPSTPRTMVEEKRLWTGSDGKYTLLANGKKIRNVNYYHVVASHTSRETLPGGYSIQMPTMFYGTWTENDYQKLISQVVTQAKNHKFNLAVALGEGNKTVRMVSSTLVKLYQAYRQLRRGNLTGAARSLTNSPKRHKNFTSQLTSKDISDAWLEMSYGWTPLLADVYESANAFHRLTAGPRYLTFKVARANKSSRLDKTNVNYWWEQEGLYVITYHVTIIEELSAVRNLGLLDPLTVAWELTPFSFVADWFIPIGDYLTNLSTVPALNGYYNRSDLHRLTGRGKGQNASYANCRSDYKTTYFDRFGSAYPLKDLRVPLPEFVSWPESLSPRHVFNGIALLNSVVSPESARFHRGFGR